MVGVLPPELAKSRWRPSAAERRALQREHAHFERVRRAQSAYEIQLRKVARHVGDLISSFRIGDLPSLPELIDTLTRYGRVLEPWARSVAERMVADVTRRDATAWFKTSRELGLYLKREIAEAPIGEVIRKILEDQVHLITSIPTDAARRVQELTLQYASGGRRYDDLVQMIRRSGPVTKSRATLIARTETAKAQSAIVQARARYVGAEGYIWRTVKDRDVRRMHKRLEGTFHRWDDPPIAEENGDRHHPGEFPNCRCYADPLLPELIQ